MGSLKKYRFRAENLEDILEIVSLLNFKCLVSFYPLKNKDSLGVNVEITTYEPVDSLAGIIRNVPDDFMDIFEKNYLPCNFFKGIKK